MLKEEVKFLEGTEVPKSFQQGSFYFNRQSGVLRLCAENNDVWKMQFERELIWDQYNSLDEMSWEEVKLLSYYISLGNEPPTWLKVSNYNDTTNLEKGDHDKCSKTFKFNGKDVVADVIAVNWHNDRLNGTRRQGGIIFGLRGCLPIKLASNSTQIYNTTFLPESFDEEFREAAFHSQWPLKYALNKRGASDFTNSPLWLFSVSELFGENYKYHDYGIGSGYQNEYEHNITLLKPGAPLQYPYFRNKNGQPININIGNAVNIDSSYWTRSVCQAGCEDNVCVVNGQPSDYYHNNVQLPVRFGFCLDASDQAERTWTK